MKKWIVAFAGVAAVIAIGAGAVMAQTPGSGTGTSFWDRVAQKLGIDTPKLTDAIKSARTDQIDEAVQNGDLTQKQADELKQRLDQMPDDRPGLFHGGPKHGGFPMGGHGFGFGFPDAADKLADFLGISQDQLKTELQADNATLATVAEAHGKSRDDLKAFIRDGAKAKLDEAVANGDLTQKREDDALAQLDANLDEIIDGQFGFKGHHFGGPGMHRDEQNDEDDGGATPGAGVEGGLFRS